MFRLPMFGEFEVQYFGVHSERVDFFQTRSYDPKVVHGAMFMRWPEDILLLKADFV